VELLFKSILCIYVKAQTAAEKEYCFKAVMADRKLTAGHLMIYGFAADCRKCWMLDK